MDFAAAIHHIRENAGVYGIDANALYLAGESCGGCIAVAATIILRDRAERQVSGVISINPVLHTHRWAERAVHDCDIEYRDEMHFFTSIYLGANRSILPVYASPLTVQDVVGLPPIVFFAAKSDPLAAEAAAMHSRLQDAGIESYLHVDEYALHGSLRGRHYYRFARDAYDAVVNDARRMMRIGS